MQTSKTVRAPESGERTALRIKETLQHQQFSTLSYCGDIAHMEAPLGDRGMSRRLFALMALLGERGM